MGTFLFLATYQYLVATEAGHGGFGLNFDIFDTNIINLAILVYVLIYFGRKFLGNTLNERSQKIAGAISEAEGRQKKAAEALAAQQQKLTRAQEEAVQIRKRAEDNALTAKAAIAQKTAADIERLKETAAKDLGSQQEKAMAELKQRAIALALERVETRLKAGLNPQQEQELINRSIANLGGGS